MKTMILAMALVAAMTGCAARTAVTSSGQTYTCVPNTRAQYLPGEALTVVEKTPTSATAAK